MPLETIEEALARILAENEGKDLLIRVNASRNKVDWYVDGSKWEWDLTVPVTPILNVI